MKLGNRGGIHFRGCTGPGCLAPPPARGDGVHSRVLNAQSLPDTTGNPLPACAARTGANSASLRLGLAMRRCDLKAALQKLTLREFGCNSF